MYFWDTKALAKELKEGTVDQKEKFKYFLFFLMFHYFCGSLGELNGNPPFYLSTQYIVGIQLTLLLIIGLGIYLCYKINQGGDNSDFTDRFVSISFPLAIKFFIVFLIAGLIIGSLSPIIFTAFESNEFLEVDDETYATIAILIWLPIIILYYWRIWVAIKWIAHSQEGLDRTAATSS